ncbi:MAG TPA: site-2 protease family protein [Bacteroidales bacterium]|nr:site-2 protease family protein [Bacteroidales bacterium]HRT90017.1 site-2 protease family protein [Bacteroidales bacterium]
MSGFDLIHSLKLLPGIVTGLTIHEFSHAWMAKRCGDTTSHDQGRVTLNPLKHIDPLGFIMLFIAGFGWAKPVQFNESNLKNPGVDVIKIAVAGPFSNALTAMFLSLTYAALLDWGININGIWAELFIYAIFINWGLFVFNLIPLPPLDGSHILFSWFRKYPVIYQTIYRYGTLLLFGLLILTFTTGRNLLPIWPLIELIGGGFLRFLGYNI